ncbi:zinc-binding dehydrogenase [Cellulomonas fimi]|nr:zinc-binding dehydrogenase [Cellulomonas fimi]
MRAVVVLAAGERPRRGRVPAPVPGPHQALVRVTRTAACASAVRAAAARPEGPRAFPLVPGHGGHGPVVALGPGVTGVRIGDELGSTWVASACGTCALCLTGHESLCPAVAVTGVTVHGSWADLMLVDTRYAARVPGGCDPVAAAAVLSGGVSAVRALRSTGAQAGQWLVVSGIGDVGHQAVQHAVARGVRVVAVDDDEGRLALARKHGAELTVNAAAQDASREVRTRTDGGAHAALLTGAAPDVRDALALVRPGGTLTLTGVPAGTLPLGVPALVGRGLTVRGATPGDRRDAVEALDLLARGVVEPTVTVRPFDAVESALADLEAGAVEGSLVLDLSD